MLLKRLKKTLSLLFSLARGGSNILGGAHNHQQVKPVVGCALLSWNCLLNDAFDIFGSHINGYIAMAERMCYKWG